MLLPIEGAGLNVKGLSPQLKAAIASLAENRSCILARATYAAYTNVAGVQQLVMSMVFPPLFLAAGMQFRVCVGGSAINNAGANSQIGAIVVVSQGSTSQTLGYTAIYPTASATPFAWRSDIAIGVGVPGASGQYVPPLMSSVGPTNTSQYASGNQPNTAITFGGVGSTIVSDRVTSGGSFAGGFIINSGSPANGNFLSATNTQFTFDNTTQIRMDVLVSDCSSVNRIITVQSGWVEGL
jgi:hypothetical protein